MKSTEAASAANTLDSVNEGERQRGGNPAADLIRGRRADEVSNESSLVVLFFELKTVGGGRSNAIELARAAHSVRLSLVLMRFLRVASRRRSLLRLRGTDAAVNLRSQSPLHARPMVTV